MNETKNLNLSLLNQGEIDTLVGFLLSQSDSVGSSVLNQDSIDRLIQLIQYDNRRRRQEAFITYGDLEGGLKDAVTIRQSEGELCEILLERDDADGNIHIMVKSTVSGQSMEITPSTINEEDGDIWGRSLSPVLFCRIALALDTKYTAATYESVCKAFAENVFGDEGHKIPFLYLPDNQLMLGNLM